MTCSFILWSVILCSLILFNASHTLCVFDLGCDKPISEHCIVLTDIKLVKQTTEYKVEDHSLGQQLMVLFSYTKEMGRSASMKYVTERMK